MNIIDLEKYTLEEHDILVKKYYKLSSRNKKFKNIFGN